MVKQKMTIIPARKRPVIKLTNCKKKNNRISKSDTHPYTIIDFISYFWNHISKYLDNWTVCTYLKILDVKPVMFADEISDSFHTESKKMVKSFIKYPAITSQLHQYIVTGVSKIDYIKKFSDEQIKYITSPDIGNTKLIACAGSGKTRSVIGRIKFIVEHKLVAKEKVFAITFSKHAATDFHCKIRDLFPDFSNFCCLKNFSTIDSLAKSILCRVKSHKSNNIEILSIAFRNYLEKITDADIKLVSQIKDIKHLFIDEAQDLNEVQYDIIMFLHNKFGTVCELIGDPNQNIFQFRRSSSTYLLNFPGREFELTLNFRSSLEIINFSECIKPVKTSPSKSASGKSGPRVTIITRPTSDIHKLILQFVKLYSKEKDLSNVAIICPTRGTKTYDTVGLSVIFNFLKISKIPFNQLYDESGMNDERRKNVGRKPGHVNLITYHGTKGLEFDVVFVMDFYYHLFNIKPTEEEHKINRYLLYVATSRAISMMFICTYINVHGGFLNHWITQVPHELYFSDQPLKIPQLSFREKDDGKIITGVTELISGMSDEQLDMVHDILCIVEDDVLFTRRIYPDFTHIDRGKDETLFGIFCEELFYLQYYLARRMTPRKLFLIEQIIESRFIIVDSDTDYKFLKQYIASNQLTWEKYDQIKNSIPSRISYVVEKYFTREKELNNNIICTNEFMEIVKTNMLDIRATYVKYLDPTNYDYDYRKIVTDFFYLIVVLYSLDINHYYYMCNHGAEKHFLLENGAELFDRMNTYVANNYILCELDIKINIYYPKLMLCGEIDFIERYKLAGTENIVEIKCVKEISIRYYVQLMLYNFCYYAQRNKLDKLFSNKFKIVNLLTGLEHSIIMSVSSTNMFNLLIILADVGNLKFTNLNLVYDLEATDGINPVGPFDSKPYIPRANIIKRQNKFYGTVYPEITEIAIRDYDTGMILLDTLVMPDCNIKPVVQKLTGIKPDMLAGKPKIDIVRLILERKMKHFINCIMMAHNGNRFDDQIITYEKLVDINKISFLDTLHIIPIHLPPDIKLQSKSLPNIYFQLFNKHFPAHRAMSDVNALIRIMRFLKIRF